MFSNQQLLFSSVTLLLLIGTVMAVTYLEMTPYATSDCTGEESGVGFSFQVGACIPIGLIAFEVKNYKVTVDNSKSNATIAEYKDDDMECTEAIPNSPVSSYEIGGCYNAPSYGDFEWFEFFNYVLVTLVEDPGATPEYGLRSTSYSENTCGSDPLYYYYYTNQTTYHVNHTNYYSWYCSYNSPMIMYCPDGPETCTSSYNDMPCTRNLNFIHEKVYFLNSC
ncbi:hypothetical protein DLAC_10268 [Tieghemostelium lacteum]|uniref:Uncharacterized protein n=1 Tax=Tieghemostelium lacteum TaxID=361077 RepID=A0A151Z5H0_TIELA|nr:hypothetical protein DLAC_10268 [Tieghemostelium lacteum]|eukprot:KYQ89044.1 hypothetical protein DLAC_10268 [Tieghemostelium lacteum]